MTENFKNWVAEQNRDQNAGYWLPPQLIKELRQNGRSRSRREKTAKIFDDESLYPPMPDGIAGNNGPIGNPGAAGIS